MFIKNILNDKLEFFTVDSLLSSYQNFMMMCIDRKLLLYNEKTPEGGDSEIIEELLKLQVQQFSKNITEDQKWLDIEVESYKSVEEVPQPEKLAKKRKHLLIFDDCMSGPQRSIENFYTRGRHVNCNCIYLTQNWFELPRRTIRSNTNFLLIFPTDQRDLKLIYNDIFALDTQLNKDDFVIFCKDVWSNPYEFVVIDRFNSDSTKRLRKGFETTYHEYISRQNRKA